jgi:hypothetical protein
MTMAPNEVDTRDQIERVLQKACERGVWGTARGS